jgi:hypothetical protein
MNAHLPLLTAMFPGKAFLDVDEIASCLRVSRDHIYRLSSKKALPVKVSSLSDRLLVSIVEMANYLDSELTAPVVEPVVESKPELPSVPSLIVRKVGKPRGKTRTQVLFQAALTNAIMRAEIELVFHEMQSHVEALTFSDDARACSEKFDEAKDEFSVSLLRSQRYLGASFLELGLSQPEPLRKKVEKI